MSVYDIFIYFLCPDFGHVSSPWLTWVVTMGDDDDNVNDDGGEDNNHLRDVEGGGGGRKSEKKKKEPEMLQYEEKLWRWG